LYPETKEGLVWLFQDGIDAGQTVIKNNTGQGTFIKKPS
jgi:hypothetical protein